MTPEVVEDVDVVKAAMLLLAVASVLTLLATGVHLLGVAF